jgi:hypothetical protein
MKQKSNTKAVQTGTKKCRNEKKDKVERAESKRFKHDAVPYASSSRKTKNTVEEDNLSRPIMWKKIEWSGLYALYEADAITYQQLDHLGVELLVELDSIPSTMAESAANREKRREFVRWINRDLERLDPK